MRNKTYFIFKYFIIKIKEKGTLTFKLNDTAN